jgi:hypothetical protein
MTLGITINKMKCNIQHYDSQYNDRVVMLSVFMLIGFDDECCKKPFVLSVLMLNVVMLSVVGH